MPTIGSTVYEGNCTSDTTLTVSSVVVAAGEIAYLGVTVRDVDANAVISSVLFDGNAATDLGARIDHDAVFCETWRYASAMSGDVVLTFNEAVNAQAHVVVVSNIDSTTPNDSVSGTTFSAVTALSHSITTALGDRILGFIGYRNTNRTITFDAAIDPPLANDTTADAVAAGVRQAVVTRTGTGSLALDATLSAGTPAIVWGLNLNIAERVGAGTLPLTLGLAGAGTVGGGAITGDGTLALTLGLAGAGVVPVQGAGTLPLVLGLAGTGSNGVAPVTPWTTRTAWGRGLFEHFDGSLPSYMTSITGGDGTVTVADSRILMGTSAANTGGDSFAVAYPFDRTKGRYQRIGFMGRSTQVTSNTPRLQVRLISSASTPTTDTAANYATATLVRGYLNQSSGVWSGMLGYYDTGGSFITWRESSQTFVSGNGASTPTITEGLDSWQIMIDWDDVLDRVRLAWVHVASGSTFASEPHGPKLFALTDWVDLSAIQNGSATDLWVVIGWPETDITMASGASTEIDWLCHEWADDLTWTTNNESDTGSGIYNIRAWASVGGNLWLPKSRTELAIPVGGSGDWDGEAVHWRGIVRDVDGTYWMAYQGSAIGGGSSGIGIASASSIDGTWTKYASNPVLADSPGDRSFIGQVTLTCDRTDPDPARRWKMSVVGLSDVDNKRRVFLYYASQPDTTSWTLDGTLLDYDAGESSEGVHLLMAPQYFAGRWHLFYLAVNISGAPWSVYRATGATLRAGSFTKSTAVDYFPNSNGVETAITSASSTSRTVQVADTTGFARDALIMYDQDSTVANWRLGKVRKVVSSTELELYHLMPGISTTGVLRTVLKGKQAPTTLRPEGDAWTFYGTAFSVFSGHATYAANYEGGGIWSTDHPAVAPAVDWVRTPGLLLGQNGNNGSSENWGFPAPPVDPFTQRVTTTRRRRQPRRRR